MAFYRCGTGNSSEVLVDGVETEGDIKLKSLGMIFKQLHPSPLAGTFYIASSTQSSISDHYGYLFHKVNDNFYYMNNYLQRYKDGKWSILYEGNEFKNEIGSISYGYVKKISNELDLSGMSAFVLNNTLYFVGKWVDDKIVYIGKFNEVDNTFQKVVEFPYWTSSSWTKATIINDEEVYLYGYSQPIVKFSIKDNSLTEITTPLITNQGRDLIIYNNEIHMMGKLTNGTEVKHYKYLPESDTWTEISTVPTSTTLTSGYNYNAVINGNWYLYADDKIYKYNDGTWEQVALLSTFRAFNNQGLCMCHSSSRHLAPGELYEVYELVKE